MAGLLEAIAGSSDPSTADPATGLLESQRRQLAYNALGQTGALLLAAGQPMMPGQNAPILAQLGNVGGNIATQQAQVQQGNLMAQRTMQEQRKNQQQAELMKYVDTPEFQKALENLQPATKAVAMAQLKSGDMAGVLKTIQESRAETTPKFNPDGSFVIPAQDGSGGVYVDPVRGIRMNINDIGKPGSGIGQFAGGGLTGEDVLKNWSPAYGNTIKKYAAGEAQLPARLMGTAAGQKLLQDIVAFDSTFDQVNWGARFKSAQDFAPNGKTGQAIIQNNTVIDHAKQLVDYARALDNSSYEDINKIKNLYGRKTGDDSVTRFEAHKLRLVDEMVKLLKGGQASEGEINRQLAVLHSAQSPQQLQSGIEDIITAAESRKSAQLAQYETALGRKPTAERMHAYFNPVAQASAEYVKANPLPNTRQYEAKQAAAQARLQGTGQTGAAPTAQGSTAAPAPGQAAMPTPTDIAYLRANPGVRAKFEARFGPADQYLK